jgi:hypothetical protein
VRALRRSHPVSSFGLTGLTPSASKEAARMKQRG